MTPTIRDRVSRRADAALERWVRFTTPRVERVLDETDWTPDAPGAYCHRCGVTVGPGEATATGCGTCRDAPGLADGVVRLGAYADELREWVLAVKYQGWEAMAEALGRQLGAVVAQARPGAGDALAVVPLPMPWQRRLYRGIDHAALIAAGAATVLGAPMLRLLTKRNGPPQVSLPTSQRRRSGARGMRVRTIGPVVPNRRWIRDSTVLLVDDVCTTGASLRAAARLLRPLKPARIIVAVVAVSDDRARRQRHGPRDDVDRLA